ncbi:MAG: mannose-1-phosphate guanylyltransferase/mannose-6-phosphate isomerase [Proteobacteria bacterium]|nr:mannose-1-phosphate guanylyltransferase/mannose-6-phosphate isomerase [Pseudomonadota bacterium]
MALEHPTPASIDHQELLPVILCGGRGTRLWPLSRERYPKQFIEFADGKTLLGATLLRAQGLGVGEPLVICNNEYRFLAAQELAKLNLHGTVILEPEGRNTAPAAAVAALLAEPDQVLLILPADHKLEGGEVFNVAVEHGMALAKAGRLVCFGVVPRSPETGYGYLRMGAKLEEGVFEVEAFEEKPDLERAQALVASGHHFWNSGMFMFTARAYLESLQAFAPAMLEACRAAVVGVAVDLDFLRLDEKAFKNCPADSIDYAVMEKSDKLCMVELGLPWSDLGSWPAVQDSGSPDGQGNVTVGDVVARESQGCYLHSTGTLIAALGLTDTVVVETGDALLVARRDKLDGLKELVGELSESGRREVLTHQVVYRPWGSYQTIAQGERFQVKRIMVKPGQTLSLQKHHHRAEHWVVVQGTARVTNGDKELTLTEDQSTYIPLGHLHRLHNPGMIPLEMIEVQTGSYLGEDDIVRLEDIYGRKGETPKA